MLIDPKILLDFKANGLTGQPGKRTLSEVEESSLQTSYLGFK